MLLLFGILVTYFQWLFCLIINFFFSFFASLFNTFVSSNNLEHIMKLMHSVFLYDIPTQNTLWEFLSTNLSQLKPVSGYLLSPQWFFFGVVFIIFAQVQLMTLWWFASSPTGQRIGLMDLNHDKGLKLWNREMRDKTPIQSYT